MHVHVTPPPAHAQAFRIGVHKALEAAALFAKSKAHFLLILVAYRCSL